MAGRGPDEGSAKAAWISEGFSSRVRTRKTVPGWKTPSVERREAACPQGTRAPSTRCQTKMVRQSALRSLTCVRGKANDGGPHADQIAGAMNHVRIAVRNVEAQ